ncbi:hypothetical protein [Fluviicola sp.]|uniref:hypothetical protein n=1 Tax=Fluviicola sp. TaxID=1917219 RepID=UPI0031D1F301
MKTITFLAFVLTAYVGISQTVITQNVKHGNSSGIGTTNGCSTVRLIVDYTVGGVGYSVSSANTSLDEGNTVTLSATVPASAGSRPTITAKRLLISAPSNSYVYTITGAANGVTINYPTQLCPNEVYSTQLLIDEIPTLVEYVFTY